MKRGTNMGVSWLFFDGTRPLEVWAKCSKCGKWNKIREKAEISDFKPTPEKPVRETCKKCGSTIVIQRVSFARKGMKKPREDC
jgi:predicted ATP-dependent serine protease